MPDTALDIVENRILSAIMTPTPDFQVFPGRSDDEPLQEGEWPGVVPRFVDIDISPMPGEWQWLHTATVEFDCISGNVAGETIDKINRETAAVIVERVFADPTLGGRLQDLQASSLSGAESKGADIGTAVLAITVQFITPIGDLRTLIGAGGQIFTD